MTTILVVDGDAAARRTTQYILQAANYTVAPALDMHQATMHLMRMRCDLLITELASFRFDGFAFLRAVRTVQQYHDLPIIVLTSSGYKREHQRALQLGATMCFSKPVRSDMLVSVVHRTLHQRVTTHQTISKLSLMSVPESSEGMPVELAV